MWQGQPATIIPATFTSYGRVPWAALTQALRGATAAWADYDGFHIGEAPVAAPPYTHVWAWADDWLLRARIDGEQAIVATLHLTGRAPVDIDPGAPASPVKVTRYLSRTWPSDEQRVGPLAEEVTGRLVELYQLDGTHPITFVRPVSAEDGPR